MEVTSLITIDKRGLIGYEVQEGVSMLPRTGSGGHLRLEVQR